jgi:hypothetical protein
VKPLGLKVKLEPIAKNLTDTEPLSTQMDPYMKDTSVKAFTMEQEG